MIKPIKMKKILFLLLMYSSTSVAQSHCGVPEYIITSRRDEKGILSDSCDINYNYYMFDYKLVPKQGYYYSKRNGRTVIFYNAKVVRVLAKGQIVWRAPINSDVGDSSFFNILDTSRTKNKDIKTFMKKNNRIGTIPDTSVYFYCIASVPDSFRWLSVDTSKNKPR